MDAIGAAYVAIADLNLWAKIVSEEPLSLADLPKILKYRYTYILENWGSNLRSLVESRVGTYRNPDRLRKEMDAFDEIVGVELTRSASTRMSESRVMSFYYTVMDSILLEDIPITKQEQVLIEAEMSRVGATTKTGFIKMREAIVAGRDAVSDSIGGSDDDYNRIYSRSPLSALLDKNIPSIITSSSMEEAIDSINSILANSNLLSSTAGIDPFAFARANANNPSFNISSYSSGVLVRLEYGETLPHLATRVYGDSTRWVEIAIANGLKPPYIDEIGDAIPLISNGSGSRINISKTDGQGRLNKNKLFVGQVVIFQSDVEKIPDQRTIQSFREIPVSGELVIEISGTPDMDRYEKVDDATMRVYLPNTINSNFYILVPSVLGAPETSSQEIPWFLLSKGEDEKKVGIDFMLSDDGDLMFSSFGDIQLAYAVDNAVQAIKLKMETEVGSLPSHQDFGLSAPIGSVKSELAQQVITESVVQQVAADARFSRLDYLTVESISSDVGTSGYLVKLGVVLAGGSTVIPISFKVNKG